MRPGARRLPPGIRGLLALVRIDLLRWINSPASLAAALLPPLGLGALLLLLTTSVGRQPVALVVQGHSRGASILARGFTADTDAYIVHRVSMSEAKSDLSDQLVAAIIRIPAGFSFRSETGHVDLILNNVDTDFSDDIRRSVTRTVALFDLTRGTMTDLDADDNTDTHPTVYPVYLTFQLLRKTNVPFSEYQLVSVLILLVINIGLLSGALLTADDVGSGTGRLLLLAPISKLAVAAGKVVASILATWALLTPVLVAGAAIGVLEPPAAHWPWLLLVLFGTSVFAGGLGLAVSAMLQGSGQVALLSINLATVLFFLGGGFTVIAFLPGWVQQISLFVPTRYGIDALRQTLFYPDLTGVARDIAVLLVSGAVATIAGGFLLARSIRVSRP